MMVQDCSCETLFLQSSLGEIVRGHCPSRHSYDIWKLGNLEILSMGRRLIPKNPSVVVMTTGVEED